MKIRNWIQKLALFALGAVLMVAAPVVAQTIRSGGSFLQPGDVTSSHILNGTIVNADVSGTAAIDGTKVKTGANDGTIPFSGNNKLSTSTDLTYNSTTRTFSSLGSTTLAASTTFNGVNLYWPSTQCSSGQTWTNNGSGTLGCTTLSSSVVLANFTAGETIAAGAPVSLGVDSTITYDNADDSAAQHARSGGSLSTTNWVAISTTTKAAPLTHITAVNQGMWNQNGGGGTDDLVMQIRADCSGSPCSTVLASKSIAASNQNNCASKTFTLDTPLAVSAATTYWIVFTSTEVGEADQICNAQTGLAHTYKTSSDGTTWGGSSTGPGLEVSYSLTSKSYVYRSSAAANDNYANSFIGLAAAASTFGNSITLHMAGLSTATTTCTANTTYYLSDTSGVLQTSAGTQSRKIGVCLGTAGFLLRPDNI